MGRSSSSFTAHAWDREEGKFKCKIRPGRAYKLAELRKAIGGSNIQFVADYKSFGGKVHNTIYCTHFVTQSHGENF